MPMIQLTAPAGALTDQGRSGVQRDLARVLLRWEGAPDTAFFRAQAWSCLNELSSGAQTTAEDDLPRFRVDVPRRRLGDGPCDVLYVDPGPVHREIAAGLRGAHR